MYAFFARSREPETAATAAAGAAANRLLMYQDRANK